jgi:hypothetical protein
MKHILFVLTLNPLIWIILFLAFSGCDTLGTLLDGDFGMEGEDGDKYECVENLDKCVNRCEVHKDGKKYFKEFKLSPDKCEKEQPA